MTPRGGAREGAGRKVPDEYLKRRNVMLADSMVADFKARGNGNVSLGIRKAHEKLLRFERSVEPDR